MHELFIINSNVENLFSPLTSRSKCIRVLKTEKLNCLELTYESGDFFFSLFFCGVTTVAAKILHWQINLKYVVLATVCNLNGKI